MKILYFKSLKSTQSYIKENLNKYQIPILIYTNNQTSGIGSRDNHWFGEDGSLFFSFAVEKSYFNEDIPLSALSIYVGFYVQKILSSMGSKVFLKWPNDLYIKKNKISGLISWVKKDIIIIGCGINTKKSKNFQCLDIKINDESFLKQLILELEKKESWNEIFIKYEKEFHKNYDFYINHNNKQVSLQGAKFQKDGTILINNEKIFNCR